MRKSAVAPSRRACSRAWRTASVGEVDPYQPGPGAGGDLQAVAATAAGQVHQRAAREQAQRHGGFGDPVGLRVRAP